MFRQITIVVLMSALLTLSPLGQGPPQHTAEWAAMAAKIVERLDLQPGEKVLILTHPQRFEELVPYLRYEIMKAGAVDLGNLDVLAVPFPADWSMDQLVQGSAQTREGLKELLEGVDATIKLPGAQSGPAYLAVQDLLRDGQGRAIHFHWEGAYPLHGQPLPPQIAIDLVYQKALLESDYEALATTQARFEHAMRNQTVRVTTPAGTDVSFRIGNRPVTRQDGNASAARASRARNLIDREIELPSGAIRVAPIEETVSGSIVFPQSIWDGRPVYDLRMDFEAGRLQGFKAVRGNKAVEAEITRAGDAGRAFREFALGFNPLLAVPEQFPWIPYYGYGAGVVRLSLGDNSELGGIVTGGYVRWNFFEDATVHVGDVTWVRDGRLTPPPE